MFFQNRIDAGKKLAEAFLKSGKDFSGFEVVGIARGGVIVAAEIARELNLPLHSICVKEMQTEKKSVVVGSFGNAVIFMGDNRKNQRFVSDVSKLQNKNLLSLMREIRERNTLYNDGEVFEPGKKIILCDDGLVSGNSAFSAISLLRCNGVEEITLGIPVVPPWFIKQKLDFEVITWRVSTFNFTTGYFYFSFPDTSNKEVINAVKENKQGTRSKQHK